MKKHLAQYLNDIVSITIMLLMVTALVAGQAASKSTGASERAGHNTFEAVRMAGED